MELAPLFESDSHEKRLQTIRANVEIVSGRLWGSGDLVVADKVSLLEHAVTINDKKDRDEFVGLIGKWHYIANLQIEAHKALKSITAQLATLANHIGNPS